MRWWGSGRRRRVAPLAALARYPVLLGTGPEAIAGSTRLKAATTKPVTWVSGLT